MAGDSAAILRALETLTVENKNTRLELRDQVAKIEGTTAADLLAFKDSHKELQDSITKMGTDTDDKLAQLAADLRRWATAQFATPSGSTSSGANAGSPAGKRARSADSSARPTARVDGTSRATAGPAPSGFGVWIGGFQRKLVSPLLAKAANDIIDKYCRIDLDPKPKIIARAMSAGFKIIFVDDVDAKALVTAFKIEPFDWHDPRSPGALPLELFCRMDRSAADRIRIGLISIFWGLLNPLLIANSNWRPDVNKLRSTGASGALWVEDAAASDGYDLLAIRFFDAGPTAVWNHRNCNYYGIEPAVLEIIRVDAINLWKEKFGSE
jgi:hypothetical protein